MKQIRKRLTYANVISSLALFLVLAGGTAFAASQLGKNSVGSKQIKRNAVTAAKVKRNAITTAKVKDGAITGAKVKNGAVNGDKVQDGSLTGSDINLGTLGTVPSATTANALNGHTPISFFMGPGVKDVATVGPFTLKAECNINNGGMDKGVFLLYTSVNGASMDDNNGDEYEVFDVIDNPAFLFERENTTGLPEIEVANEPGLSAVAPDGTAITLGLETIGFNIADKPGQCYFSGILDKVG